MGKASREKWEKRFAELKARLAAAEKNTTPWWESNILWSGFVGLILIVVVSAMKDLRWLLLVAWACSFLIAWSIAKNFSSRKGKNTCLFLIIATAGLLLYWLNALLKPNDAKGIADQQPFHVELRVALTNLDDNMWADFMVAYNSELGLTLSPIHFLLYLQIVNTQNRQSTITSYSLEAGSSPEGPWKRLTPIHIGSDNATYNLTGGGPKKAKEFQFLPLLYDVLNERGFGPYETRFGWAFFAGKDIVRSHPAFFKLSLRDSAGATTTEILAAKLDSPGTVSFQEGTFKVLRTGVDLTKFPVKYFPE